MRSVLFLPILLFCTILHAQNVATIEATTAAAGRTVTVTYDPAAPGAVHSSASELFAVMMMLHPEQTPRIKEQRMERSGAVWTATFTMAASPAVRLAFRFDTEEASDDNNGEGWSLPVTGANGKPVKGADYMQAIIRLQKNYFGFFRSPDTQKALAALKQEVKRYPDHWRAATMTWMLERRLDPSPRNTKRISGELTKLYAKQKKNEEAVRDLLSAFRNLERNAEADSIEARWIRTSPNGAVARAAAAMQFNAERDPVQRAALAARFTERFTPMPGMEAMILSAFLRAKEYATAAAFLEKHPDVSPNYYNSIAYGLIAKGEDLESAVRIAKQGLDKVPMGGMRTMVEDVMRPRSSWKENLPYQRGMIADTYAEGLMKLGRYAEAEPVLEESNTLMQQDDPDNNARLVECYAKNGKHRQAVDASYSAVVKGRSNEHLISLYRSSYEAVNGSAAKFDSVLAAAKVQMKKELRTKLEKEQINAPSVDFELKGLDGSMVKLSSLKGKVVVLDFWATWCGPCLSSFPTLQKVYDKYKSDSNVVILAMNTWERVAPEEREAHVKAFIEKNKYTFPVVFDTDLVRQYGVEGIPTKFILDKEGKIRFKDVGFGGADEMEQKMELQFEMLLGYASR